MVYSLRFVYYVVISTRTLSLIRKEDVDRFVLIAYFYLIGGSLRAAKKLSERLVDSLPLPLVSVRAKLRVLIMLTVLAPVVFYLCSFSPPKRDIKSLISLFFLAKMYPQFFKTVPSAPIFCPLGPKICNLPRRNFGEADPL